MSKRQGRVGWLWNGGNGGGASEVGCASMITTKKTYILEHHLVYPVTDLPRSSFDNALVINVVRWWNGGQSGDGVTAGEVQGWVDPDRATICRVHGRRRGRINDSVRS
jgi:hypothetical protein